MGAQVCVGTTCCHMHGISGWRADPQQLVAAEPGAIQHVLKRRGLAKAA